MFEFEQLVALIQWAADLVDPAAFASRMVSDPLDTLTYDPAADSYAKDADVPAAQVIVQMAVGDATNPNVGTRQLARAADISDEQFERSVYSGDGVGHGFTLGNTPQGDCARRQAAAWLASGLNSGTAEFPAELDSTTCP